MVSGLCGSPPPSKTKSDPGHQSQEGRKREGSLRRTTAALMETRRIGMIQNTETEKRFCCFLPYRSQPSSCHCTSHVIAREESKHCLPRDHQHVSHRAEQAFPNRSHCPNVHPYTSPPSQPPLHVRVREIRVVGFLHANVGFDIWKRFLLFLVVVFFVFFLNTLLKPSC